MFQNGKVREENGLTIKHKNSKFPTNLQFFPKIPYMRTCLKLKFALIFATDAAKFLICDSFEENSLRIVGCNRWDNNHNNNNNYNNSNDWNINEPNFPTV